MLNFCVIFQHFYFNGFSCSPFGFQNLSDWICLLCNKSPSYSDEVLIMSFKRAILFFLLPMLMFMHGHTAVETHHDHANHACEHSSHAHRNHCKSCDSGSAQIATVQKTATASKLIKFLISFFAAFLALFSIFLISKPSFLHLLKTEHRSKWDFRQRLLSIQLLN